MHRKRGSIRSLLAGVGAGCAALLCACAGLLAQSSGEPLPDVQWNDPGANAIEPRMRVLLERGSSGATIGGPESVSIGVADGTPGFRIRTPLRVSRDSLGWHLVGPGDTTRVVSTEGPILLETDGAPMTLGARRLGGTLYLHVSGSSVDTLDVVEHVPIETYLPGVIIKELVASWSPTAFEVQAICARSYALHERNRQRLLGSHYDLEGTTQDQVYSGETFSSRAHRAVRATRGRVLMYNGRVLRAYYSSTCGGRAASARDVWPTTHGFEFNLLSPIQASPRPGACEISPLYRWTVERSAEAAAARINAWAPHNSIKSRALIDVRSIGVDDANAFGRPRLFRLTDSSGHSLSIQAEALRNALNYSDGAAHTAPDREHRVHSSDFVARISGSRLVLEGRGFGHGVGMCQYGIEGLARRGSSVREILEMYYPQARVERRYR